MLSFDPDADDDTNAIGMQKGYENVQTGQVTFAARDSEYEGHHIKKGEILASKRKKIDVLGQKTKKALTNKGKSAIIPF
jgi:dihydroxyacetone kinase-like predicted kinase